MTLTTAQGHLNWYKTNKSHYTWFYSAWLQLITSYALCMILLSMTAAHHFMCIIHDFTQHDCSSSCALRMILFSMTAAHHSLCTTHDFVQYDFSSSLPVHYAWFCSAWLQLITSCASPRTANDMYANMQLSNSMCCSITCRTLQYTNWNETDLISQTSTCDKGSYS